MRSVMPPVLRPDDARAGMILQNALETDPFFANVISLLSFDGTNGSTTITDAISGVVWTANGNAQISTTNPKYGSGCLLLDGTGDFIQAAHSANWVMDTDFTFEGWVSPSLIAGSVRTLYAKRNVSANNNEWTITVDSAGKLNAVAWASGGASTVVALAGATTIPLDAYTPWAVTRSGSVWRVFVDGVLDGEATQTGTPNTNSYPVAIGTSIAGTGSFFNGRMDEFRVTRGVCRYTATYTPRTSPFPRS